MTKIAFIGLGVMGRPMALNLLKAGFDVTGYNRGSAKTGSFVASGGQGADSIAAAVADADVVATMVPDSPDVEAVLLGADGVLANAKAGALIIDFSTIRPDVATELARTAREAGFGFLDAPVSGGEQGAIDGALSVMVGGSAHDFEAAAEVFDAVGTTIVHVGPTGSGQTVKAANQLIVAGHLALLSEAIVFLRAHGVEMNAAVEVLGGGLAGSAVLTRKATAMLDRNFTPGFRLELHHKDLGIVGSAARAAGVVTPVSSVVAQLVASTVAQGDGALDHTAILKVLEQLSSRADPGQ